MVSIQRCCAVGKPSTFTSISLFRRFVFLFFSGFIRSSPEANLRVDLRALTHWLYHQYGAKSKCLFI